MLTLFREGGYPMYFVVLFGGLGLATAVFAVFRPDSRRFEYVKWMMLATALAAINGTFADLGAVFHAVARFKEQGREDWSTLLFEGLGESMAPGIMGFALLALTAMTVAIAKRRAPVM